MADFTVQELTSPVFSVVADSADATNINSGGGGTVATYAQRVWSSGLGLWCYYTGALDGAPASVDTTPNWTGSISDYNVISRRLD